MKQIMELRQVGEFGLIQRIRKWTDVSRPDLLQGVGDDVAVIDRGERALLVTTDILIEDVHFERTWTDPYLLGKKALMVNLSDIAAMGGTPRYFLISLGLPKQLPFRFVSRLYRGLKEGARRYDVALVGGDTSLSPRIVLNICLLGEGKRDRLLFRKGAKVGDDLFVSGTLGDSALGLKLLKGRSRREASPGLIRRHLLPTPRIELGKALARGGWATAMIDVSDGLLSDLSHLMEESGVGALLWENRLPLSRPYRKFAPLFSEDLYEIALSGGEDYELLFSAPPSSRRKISALSRSLKLPITCIGKIAPPRDGLRVLRPDGSLRSPLPMGFDHFRRRSL